MEELVLIVVVHQICCSLLNGILHNHVNLDAMFLPRFNGDKDLPADL